MNTHERRALLAPIANTERNHDYLVQFEHRFASPAIASDNGVMLCLRYVPERSLVSSENLAQYLKAFETEDIVSIEALASIILGDLNNELIPYWLHVHLTYHHAGTIHQTIIEDRQPDWHNPELLARLNLI